MMVLHPTITDTGFTNLFHPLKDVSAFAEEGIDFESVLCIVEIPDHAGVIGVNGIFGKYCDLGQFFSISIDKGDHGLSPSPF